MIAHPRGNLGGFRTGCGGDIHNAFWLVAVSKQGRDRQHGTGFLNVEQAT